MATIKVRDAIDIEQIYVKVPCPRCNKEVSYHLKRPVTRKLCPGCSKVEFFFTVTPLEGYVSITCPIMNGVFPGTLEIDSTQVEIAPKEGGEQ